ncbi:MAG TPA: hypothetical protein VIM58_02880 [Candidatus Methylacidiphilales bacterium]
MRARFLRSFSCTLAVVYAAGALALLAWWRPQRAQLPPPPPLPDWKIQFLDYYGGRGDTTHGAFYCGLGGMRERLEKSDVILLGSSHVIFGLSAERLSQRLSERKGRPVRAYNMGTDYGEGTRFGAEALTRNGIDGKAVVLDLFHLDLRPAMTEIGNRAAQGDAFSNAVEIAQVHVNFFRDRLLEPWPCLRPEKGGHARFARRLDQILVRASASGDLVYCWLPEQGYVFPSDRKSFAIDPDDAEAWKALPNRGQSLAPGTLERLAVAGNRPFATVIPYPGAARAVPPAPACPFLPIPAEGCRTFDGSHLTPEGRERTTDALAERLAPLLP